MDDSNSACSPLFLRPAQTPHSPVPATTKCVDEILGASRGAQADKVATKALLTDETRGGFWQVCRMNQHGAIRYRQTNKQS